MKNSQMKKHTHKYILKHKQPSFFIGLIDKFWGCRCGANKVKAVKPTKKEQGLILKILKDYEIQ